MWVRFDDQFTTHRKVNGLTDTEFRLHVEAIFWCARNLTDGRVGQDELDLVSRIRSPRKHVAKLVDRGLWHRYGQHCQSETCPAHEGNAVSSGVTDGWVIHDYFEYQFTKDRVLKEREENAKRQKKWRDQQKQNRNGVTNGERNASSNSAPARPGPARSSGTGGEVAHGGARTRETGPGPPRNCSKHEDDPDPPPCGACADARRRWVAWDVAHRQAEATRRSAEAHAQAEVRALAISQCGLCDGQGYLPTGRQCQHDPSRVEATQRGAAAARAALLRGSGGTAEAA
jgi:hypothetical protein